jgi:hypothetical protein
MGTDEMKNSVLDAMAAKYGVTEMFQGPGACFTCVVNDRGIQFSLEQVNAAVAEYAPVAELSPVESVAVAEAEKES